MTDSNGKELQARQKTEVSASAEQTTPGRFSCRRWISSNPKKIAVKAA